MCKLESILVLIKKKIYLCHNPEDTNFNKSQKKIQHDVPYIKCKCK